MSAADAIDLAEAVAARIRDQVPDLRHDTKGALDFAALVAARQLPQRMPAAFVIDAGFVASDAGRRVGGTSSTMAHTVAVVLVQNDARDATGDAARAAVWPLEKAVLKAIHGWSPARGYAEFLVADGRLQGVGGDARVGAVACTLTFETEWKLHTRTGGV